MMNKKILKGVNIMKFIGRTNELKRINDLISKEGEELVKVF